MRTGIILQARFGSTRLHGKALARLGTHTVLERCLDRLALADVGEVVLATTQAAEDDALAAVAERGGFMVFRGSTDDVLGRYVDAATAFGFDIVLRATGDNPAVDIAAPRRLLNAITMTGADYVCEDGLPYGGGVEIVTTPALVRAAACALGAADREHVTTFIKLRTDMFRVVRLLAPRALQRPTLRVTVDTAADLSYVRALFAQTHVPQPTLGELIAASELLAGSHAA